MWFLLYLKYWCKFIKINHFTQCTFYVCLFSVYLEYLHSEVKQKKTPSLTSLMFVTMLISSTTTQQNMASDLSSRPSNAVQGKVVNSVICQAGGVSNFLPLFSHWHLGVSRQFQLHPLTTGYSCAQLLNGKMMAGK